MIKPWDQVRLRVVLAFPDLYEIGFSHLGLRLLYQYINKEHYLAERVYAPAADLEQELRKAGLPLFSVETRHSLAQFDVVGFTLQYELSYTNILNMMNLAGIPIKREDRGETDPLIIGGGPGSFNPEPISAFFDLFLLGEGEEAILEILAIIADGKEKGKTKAGIKQDLLKVEGVYLPEFYRVEYTDDGKIAALHPVASAPPVVQKRILRNFTAFPLPTADLVPWIEPIHDRAMVELFRGCTRGCRFCQAGMIYRPVRERSPATIEAYLQNVIAHTGYEEISLTSLSSADYTKIQELFNSLTACFSDQNIKLSLPSLRVDSFSPELAARFQSGRKGGLTFAPEAGTERLRQVINKNLSEEQILTTAQEAFAAGWQRLKLYFMIGLPTETDEDLEGIVRLAKEILALGRRLHGPKAGRVQVTVSASTFVPKPHTPFQWRPQISLTETERRQKFLKDRLVGRGLQFSWHDPSLSQLEGVFARGDRRLGKTLVKAWELGCTFDSWPDQFHWDRWVEALEATDVQVDAYLRPRAYDEILPWDHLSAGLTKTYLRDEDQRAEQGQITLDCRARRGCSTCGVCSTLGAAPERAGGEND